MYLTFNGNGHGEGDESDVTGSTDTITVVLEGDAETGTATLPACGFQRAGYTFVGWAESAAYAEGETLHQPGEDYTVTLGADNTLYARWSDDLTYDKNATDATGEMDQTLGMGTGYATVAANGFTRPGYVFAGWNTAADGTGTAYMPGDRYDLVEGVVDVVYAQWDECLVYDANCEDEGLTPMGAQTSDNALNTVTVAENGFGRGKGYVFLGWKHRRRR